MMLLAGIQNGAGNGAWYWLSAIMTINILFSVAYYLRVVQILILKEPSSLASKAKEAPMSMLFPMVLLAIMCIVVGVYPGPFVDLANKAAQAAFNLDLYVKSVVG
jgi:formate hydrogenlyase subunit 3/multisubunit Na+/H+ antiporter MnhD subunit